MTYFKELGYITTMDDIRKEEKRRKWHILILLTILAFVVLGIIIL